MPKREAAETTVTLEHEGRKAKPTAGQIEKVTKALENANKELPGMPEKTELAKLAEAYIFQKSMIEQEIEGLEEIKEKILTQLRSEGRPNFAFARDGHVYTFEVTESLLKLSVRKK